MIFKQLFDKNSSTYTYLVSSGKGREALIIDPVLENVGEYINLLKELDLKLVKVIDVYDGDTITVAMNIQSDDTMNLVYLPKMVHQFRIRMHGYNTEEIRQPKDDPDREKKKEWALYQRDWVVERLLNKIVLLECLGYDKYGRILGKVYLDSNKQECINDIIVSSGVASKFNY